MTLKNTFAAVSMLVLGATLGCGKEATPCAGSACLQVAGTYQAAITQSPGTTCKYIIYGESSFTTDMVITQQGSALTVSFPDFLNVTIPGTLRTDNTADFDAASTANVDSTDGSMAFAYNDNSTLDISFVQSGSAITATGTKQDILTAVNPSPDGDPDTNCILQGSVSATLQ